MFRLNDISFDVKQKGLDPQTRGKKGYKVVLKYLLKYHFFVTNQSSEIVPHVDLNLIVPFFRSFVT